MGSPLYHVEVLDQYNQHISLEVMIIHPDEYGLYDKSNFVIQLLWDVQTLFFQKKSAAFEWITIDLMQNPDFVCRHSDEWIKDFEIIATKNYPKNPDKSEPCVGYYEIDVTDEKIIAHLQKGMQWESGAYDMTIH